MPPVQRKSLLAISAAVLVLGLAACDSADDRMAATHESAAGRTDHVAKDSRAPAREAARETREAPRQAMAADAGMDRAARDTRAMGAAAADKTRAAGVAAAGKIDDASITAKVNAALAGDQELSAIAVDVDTRDGVVTLSGPAPTASAKERAAEVAHRVNGVQSVNNQLTITSS